MNDQQDRLISEIVSEHPRGEYLLIEETERDGPTPVRGVFLGHFDTREEAERSMEPNLNIHYLVMPGMGQHPTSRDADECATHD